MKDQPVCPDCKEVLVKSKIENEEGDWLIAWLCGCKVNVERKPDGNGKWYLYLDGVQVRELTDKEAAREIWAA